MAIESQMTPTRGAVIFGNPNQDLVKNTIGMMESERQRVAKERAQQAQQLANSWRQNALTASSGRLWSDEIGKIEQDHLLKGEQLMASGIDPYSSTDPRAVQYRQERLQVEGMQNFRKNIEKEYSAINTLVQRDPNKWRPEDLKQLNDFVSGTKFKDIYEQSISLPQVRERFNVTDALKGYKAPVKQEVSVKDGQKRDVTYVDRNEAERGILSRLNQSPGGQEYLSSITGGYTPSQLRNAPDDLEGASRLIEGFYDSNPAFREELATMGITSKNDPRYSQVIQEEAQNLLDSKQKYNQEIEGLIDQASGGVRTSNKVTPDYTEARERRSRQSHYMQVQRFNERFMTKSTGSGSSSSEESYSPSRKEYIAYGDEGSMGKAPVYGYTPFNAAGVEFVGNGMIDLETGKAAPDQAVVSGTVVALGNIPSGKNNRALSKENFAIDNPGNVAWRKMALVETKEGSGSLAIKKQYLVPVENLPNNIKSSKLVTEFKNSSFSPPTTRPGAKTAQPAKTTKASSTTLNFFK